MDFKLYPRVYVARATCGAIKVGVSLFPKQRLIQVGRDFGEPFELLYQTEELPHAYQAERKVHEKLRPYLGSDCKGEYYAISSEAAIAVVGEATRR